MKNTELRIGNLVYDFTDHCNINILAEDLTDVSNFKPIPLTEEWLERFGFDGDQQEGWESTCGRCVYLQDWRDNDYRHVSNRGCCVMQIKYVHSLQNLYFALTGEELIIK